MDDLTSLSNIEGPATRLYHLVLVSHSYANRLSPAPGLTFDLRRVKNPPKHIRDAYDGRSKRLREYVVREDVFMDLLNTAGAEIETKMRTFDQEDHENHALALSDSVTQRASNNPDAKDPISAELAVSCFCERGKHRSVAFVEELARRKWPSQWIVEICHRDVENSSLEKQRQRDKEEQRRQKSQGFAGAGSE